MERLEADLVVIGAGVIGLAVARACARKGRDVIVLEAEDLIASHTSSRNSEVIHAGLYYPKDSLKARFCAASMYPEAWAPSKDSVTATRPFSSSVGHDMFPPCDGCGEKDENVPAA